MAKTFTDIILKRTNQFNFSLLMFHICLFSLFLNRKLCCIYNLSRSDVSLVEWIGLIGK